MTWRTPDGDRRLTGPEATLVREAIATISDQLGEILQVDDESEDSGAMETTAVDRRCDFGVLLFDELTPTEQLVVVSDVGRHLLNKTAKTLPLTAVNEAAVFALFQAVLTNIVSEIEQQLDDPHFSPRTWWRALVRDVMLDSPVLVLEAVERSVDEVEVAWWTDAVESLADRILWDRDFELAPAFLDSDPVEARALKQSLGIDADYFVAVPPDLRPDQVDETLHRLRRLARSKPR